MVLMLLAGFQLLGCCLAGYVAHVYWPRSIIGYYHVSLDFKKCSLVTFQIKNWQWLNQWRWLYTATCSSSHFLFVYSENHQNCSGFSLCCPGGYRVALREKIFSRSGSPVMSTSFCWLASQAGSGSYHPSLTRQNLATNFSQIEDSAWEGKRKEVKMTYKEEMYFFVVNHMVHHSLCLLQGTPLPRVIAQLFCLRLFVLYASFSNFYCKQCKNAKPGCTLYMCLYASSGPSWDSVGYFF